MIIQAVSLVFLAALAWVATVMYRQHRVALYSLGDARRAALYAAAAVLAITLTGTARAVGTSGRLGGLADPGRRLGLRRALPSSGRLAATDRTAPSTETETAQPAGLSSTGMPFMRELISDWLMLLAAPILLLSLFLPWSHQFSGSFLARYAHLPALAGVPRDPTAWQVYSVADVLLAALAGGLLAVALRGSRPGRVAVLLGAGIALAFIIHALAVPPTNGADLTTPA